MDTTVEQQEVTQETIAESTKNETSKLRVAHDTVQNLEGLSKTVTKENINDFTKEVSEDIRTLPLDRLPKPEEIDRKETFEDLQAGGVCMVLHLLIKQQTGENKELDTRTPEQFFASANTENFHPLELLVFQRMQEAVKNKRTAPDVWNNLFGGWDTTILTLRARAEEMVKPRQEEGKKALLQPGTTLTEYLGNVYKNHNGLILGGGLIVGGILLSNFLRKHTSDSGGLFSLNSLIPLLVGGAGLAFLSGKMPDVQALLQNIFGNLTKKSEEEEKDSMPEQKEDGIERGPLKLVWKNYAEDLKQPMNTLAFEAKANDALLKAAALKVASVHGFHNIMMSGAGLSLHAAITLAKTPFALVHGAHPGMLLLLPFIAGGGKKTLEEIGDMEVPKDKENLIKDLRQKYEYFAKHNPEHGLPLTVEASTLDTMADIILGNKKLSSYYANAKTMVTDLAKNAYERVATTEEKLIGEKNREGISAMKTFVGTFEDASNKTGTEALRQELAALEDWTKNGKKLTRTQLENLARIIEAHALPLSMVLEGDYISIRSTIPGKERLINIAINPALSLDKQKEIAKYFVIDPEQHLLQRSAGAYLTAVVDSFRARMPNLDRSKDAEGYVRDGLSSGNMVLIGIGSAAHIYVKSVQEYFTLPLTLLGKLPKLFSGTLSAQEVTSTMGWSLAPGIIVGTTKELLAIAQQRGSYFKNGNVLGKFFHNILLRGALAPITAPMDIVKGSLKAWYYKDVIQKNGLGDLLIKNPTLHLSSNIKGYYAAKMADLRSEKYGTLSILNNANVASKYSELHEIYKVTGALSEAKYNGTIRTELIRQADSFVLEGPLKHLREKHGPLSVKNYEAFLKDAVIVMQKEERTLSALKQKYKELKKAPNAEVKKKIQGEIDTLVKNGAPTHTPETHQQTKAPKTPEMGHGFGRRAKGIAGAITMFGAMTLGGSALQQAHGAAEANNKSNYQHPEEKKKTRYDRLKSDPEFFSTLLEKTKGKLEKNMGFYQDLSRILTPEHIKKTAPANLTKEINSFVESFGSSRDNILGIIQADEDILRVAFEKGPQHVNLGSCFSLAYNYQQKKLELKYATDSDIKAGLYDPIDALYFLETVRSYSGGHMGEKSAAALNLTLSAAPYTGTLMDLKRFGDATMRGQINEMMTNGAWTIAGGLADFFPPAQAFMGPARLAKLGRIGEILTTLSRHSGKIMGGMVVADLVRNSPFFRPTLSGKKEW